MKKFVITTYLILVTAIIVLLFFIRNAYNENKRHTANEKALMSEMNKYKTKAEHNAASVLTLELSNKEIKKQKKEIEDKCKELDIKIKRLQTYSNTTIESEYELQLPLHDSVFFYQKDTLKCVDYDDEYYSVHGCIEKDTLDGVLITKDTITTIVHTTPRKFLFFRFGIKDIRCDVMTSNPHTQIVKHETIIKKK